MLGWFRRLFRSSRDIFWYWDGSKQRAIDPIVAWHLVVNHEQYNHERHSAGVDRGDEESINVTCKCVQDVFGVKPFDPKSRSGLTVLEQLALLALFYGFLDTLKKTSDPKPTAPSSTESTSSESGEPTIPAM